MPHTTLISTADLADRLASPDLVLLDCRFRLDDPDAGRQLFRDGHLPGARYAHLDDDLSGPAVAGQTGRHPLPSVESFAATLAAWGVNNVGDAPTQVIAYDDAGGLFAARLWWMVRWLGHDAVAVLDGGWTKWIAEERPVERGDARSAPPATFTPHPRDELLASVDDVLANVEHPAFALLDARNEARFRGEAAGMDPVAGHIPGATSAFYRHNLRDDQTFRSPDELRARFQSLLGDPAQGDRPNGVVHSCGSGVSAAHNILAMAHAGLPELALGAGSRLYVGSWSEWITDASRPVATKQ